MTKWHHPTCFNLPRKYAAGANKMSAEEFVADILLDASDGGTILPDKAEELAEAISSKTPATSKAGVSAEGAVASGEGAAAIIQGLKMAYQKREEEGGDEPAAKKVKTGKVKAKAGDDDVAAARVDAYGEYHKMNTDALKDYLRWNHQVLQGKKDFVLLKVIDGAIRGRLARTYFPRDCIVCTRLSLPCVPMDVSAAPVIDWIADRQIVVCFFSSFLGCPLDGGKLKLTEDEVVVCSGDFGMSSWVVSKARYRFRALTNPKPLYCFPVPHR